MSYAQPTQAQKLWEGMQTLAYGGKGVVFFTYWHVDDAAFGTAMIASDGSQTSQYSQIGTVNSKLQTIGRALLSATNRYTFQNGTPASGAIRRPAGAPARVVGSTPLTVGIFDGAGYVYTLVANRDDAIAQTATTQLSYGAALPQRLSSSGTWSTVSPTSTGGGVATVATSLGAGDAVLYRTQTPVAVNDEVLIGRVRNNVGELYSVDSVGSVSDVGPAGWSSCPTGYTNIGQNFQSNGFWTCARNDLNGRGFYVGNVVANQGALWRVQNGRALGLGGFGWGYCPSSSTPLGQLFDPNGFAVCIDAPGRLGPEAIFGRVRNNGGELDVVDSANGVSNVGGGGWGTCGPGYTEVGRDMNANGYWLCARDDLAHRKYYVGNVVGGAGYFWSVLYGVTTSLGYASWNDCPASSYLGRIYDDNGFWLCIE